MLARAAVRSLRANVITPRRPLRPIPSAFSAHASCIRNYASRPPATPSAGRPTAGPAEAEPILPTDANADPISQSETPFTDPLNAARHNPEPEPEPSSGGSGRGKGRDGLPDSAYVSSSDRRRNALAKYSFLVSLALMAGGFVFLGRSLEPEEREAHPTIGDGWDAFFTRVNARRKDFFDYYNEPPFEKLLPDPLPEYSRPYTLVISLEDLMIHSEWTREHGWRVAKRPGLDYFLSYLWQYYEIVVFTDQPEQTAIPIIQKVDQYPGYITFPLFRSHTRYVDGKYVKDLRYLNRDPSKVIMLETNPSAWSAQPENTIKLPPWKGDPTDRELVALVPFLEYIAALGVPDVRTALQSFDGTHIPTEYARREEIDRERLREEIGPSRRKAPPKWLMASLGMKPGKEAEGGRDVKTFGDIARERGREAYENMQKHLVDHKEELLNEQKAQEKEMADQMKTSLSKVFTEGMPKPPGQQ